jgi:hypothetical protein
MSCGLASTFISLSFNVVLRHSRVSTRLDDERVVFENRIFTPLFRRGRIN